MPETMTSYSLARRSGFDVEDVIIELVRLGMDYATDPRAVIRAEDQRGALDAVGLHRDSDERKKSYWCDELGKTPSELEELLSTFGYRPNVKARTLPKGAHGRLDAYAKARTGPKLTIPASPVMLRKPSDELPVRSRPDWVTIGQKRVTNYLEAADVLAVHEELERDAEQASDPIFPPGVKSMDMLESACHRPHTGAHADPKYPTVEMAAAALVHSLVHNHPFHNGNKRSALVAMMVFLDRNNHWLRDTVHQADLYLWILEVARHRVLPDEFRYEDRADHEVLAMADWIKRNSRPIERSERLISWPDLRNLLVKDYGCKVDTRPGGKILITRSVPSRRRGFLGLRREEKKSYTLSASSDKKEVGLGTVKSLRAHLCLTEDFNIDSAIFYGTVRSPDQFIAKYQRLLRDLARV